MDREAFIQENFTAHSTMMNRFDIISMAGKMAKTHP